MKCTYVWKQKYVHMHMHRHTKTLETSFPSLGNGVQIRHIHKEGCEDGQHPGLIPSTHHSPTTFLSIVPRGPIPSTSFLGYWEYMWYRHTNQA